MGQFGCVDRTKGAEVIEGDGTAFTNQVLEFEKQPVNRLINDRMAVGRQDA